MPQSIVLFNLRNKIRSLLCDGEPFDRSDFYASIEYIRRIFVFRLILNCLGIQITSRRYQLALRSSNDSHQSPSIFNSYRKHKHKVRFNVCEKQSLSCEITVQIPLNIHKQVQQSEKVMSNDERNDTKTASKHHFSQIFAHVTNARHGTQAKMFNISKGHRPLSPCVAHILQSPARPIMAHATHNKRISLTF